MLDKCKPADVRADDFSLYWVPTTYYDGGYQVLVGGNITSIRDMIEDAETRTVYDVDVELDVKWLGNATMEIHVKVINNEAAAYGGRVRVYINEIVSSLGWKDTNGIDYTYPMLEFALNERITVPAGDSWEKTTVWDGNLHDSGYGQSYGNITHANTRVMAAVFNSDVHQGYSDPPTGQPFDAYYADDVAVSPTVTLTADTFSVPEGGGIVNMDLIAGQSNQMRNYLLIGGVTGTTPGFPLPGGLTLPVNWDVFSDIVMGLVNTPVFSNFMGKTNFTGNASAQLNAPALPPGTAGLKLYFAFCMNNPFNFVSNALEIEVVP